MLKVLDLFSGIGGFSLGLERTGGFETVAFCEIDEYAAKVLQKHWPEIPVFPDVHNLKRGDIQDEVDVVCGGFPCQPFSSAGKQLGWEDDRNLWPEFVRVVSDFRPTWVVAENTTGFTKLGLDKALADLGSLGYQHTVYYIPAAGVGAFHKRERLWIVAHSDSQRTQVGQPESQGAVKLREPPSNTGGYRSRVGAWLPEPDVGRVAHGIPHRLDRLRCLGNAIVPQIAEAIGYGILSTYE